MAGDLTLAKDWIYVFCTVIQTVLAVIGLAFVSFWWDRRKIKDERKRADQQRREEERQKEIQRREEERQKEIQREEDRQKADAENIAAVLSDNYYEVENIFHSLKKSVDKLRKGKIVDGFTKFHVLLYMCRQENSQRKLDSQEDPRDQVLSNVGQIMKLFLKFRIKLFSIMQNKACPDDIKSEFSSKITEMGKTIYPFVEKHRQDVIERVLNYFVSAATTQEHGLDVIHYPGNVAIEKAIPYVKYFSYEGGGSMKLSFYNQDPQVLELMTQVELEGKQEKEDEILKKIDELWQLNEHEPPVGGLLHSIRMIMFQRSEDLNFFNRSKGSFNEFTQYIKKIVSANLSGDVNVFKCKRLLDMINLCTRDLENQFDSLLVLPETNEMLNSVHSKLNEFISRKKQLLHQAQQQQLLQQK